jgi:hypothetical protein
MSVAYKTVERPAPSLAMLQADLRDARPEVILRTAVKLYGDGRSTVL